MIRAFVAIAPSDEARDALMEAQARLPAGRAVERDNLHLTLAFLGERPEPVIEDSHYALDRILAAPFALRLAGLALLGSARSMALVAEAAPEPGLSHLREKVVQAARDAGVPLERKRFRPHVTLARFNAGLAGEEGERVRAFAAQGAGFRAGPFEVEAFALVRSRLGRAGPVYETLAVYPLRGTRSALS